MSLYLCFCFSKMFPFPVYRRLDFDLRYSVFKVRFTRFKSNGMYRGMLAFRCIFYLIFMRVLCTCMRPRSFASRFRVLFLVDFSTVGLSGLEPPTSRLSGVRSNRLSYKPILIWQPPAFPYRLQYSIIGRLSLNHRVRDVDGCFP